MKQILNYDLTRYAKLGYSGEVLRQIRLAKKEDIDLTFFVEDNYDEYQLNEIRLGIHSCVDITKL